MVPIVYSGKSESIQYCGLANGLIYYSVATGTPIAAGIRGNDPPNRWTEANGSTPRPVQTHLPQNDLPPSAWRPLPRPSVCQILVARLSSAHPSARSAALRTRTTFRAGSTPTRSLVLWGGGGRGDNHVMKNFACAN